MMIVGINEFIELMGNVERITIVFTTTSLTVIFCFRYVVSEVRSKERKKLPEAMPMVQFADRARPSAKPEVIDVGKVID